MGFLQQLLGTAQAVRAQVSPFDNGQTYKTVMGRLHPQVPVQPKPTMPANPRQLPVMNIDNGQIYNQRPGTSIHAVWDARVPYYDASGAMRPTQPSDSYLAVPLKTNLQPMQRLPYIQ